MQEANILVSVIVPVYNVEDYVKRMIESLLLQDYDSFEIIMVDDGSTDRSGKIIDDFALKDGRIRAIHGRNHGVRLREIKDYTLRKESTFFLLMLMIMWSLTIYLRW